MMQRLSLVVLILLLAACGAEEPPPDGTALPPQQWRFAIEEIQGSVQDLYAQRFKELIEARSDGRVEVVVYPYGALGTSAQLTELVQNRAIEFAFASAGHLGSVVPEVQVFALHFLFPDDDDALHKLVTRNDDLLEPMGEAYRERGLELLALVPEGWMAWTANRPLRTPKDFKQLKFRTMVSPLLLKVYEQYSATPTPTAYSEVYSGLQLKMLDGQSNPVFAIEEMSFDEVQDHLVLSRHLPFIASVVTNPEFHAALDSELQDILADTLRTLDEEIRQQQLDLNRQRLATIRERSDIEISELSDAEREAFAALARPVRNDYLESAGERGQRIVEAIEGAR